MRSALFTGFVIFLRQSGKSDFYDGGEKNIV